MELLQQVRVIDPTQKTDRLSDVLIAQGQIEAISDRITDYPSQAKLTSGAGLILGPGLIDLYSHSGEPGNEGRETLLDLAQDATAGGFAQVGILPDTVPKIENLATLTAVKSRGNFHRNANPDQTLARLCFWGAASQSQGAKQMNELAELKTEVIGFTDRYSLSHLNLLKQVLEYVQPWQKTFAITLHDNELTGNGVVREGIASTRYGMSGNPGFSEAAIIAAVLEMVAVIPNPVHIMRVSTRRGVELIAQAKARGVQVTASTTWMHLLWNSAAIGSYDPNLHLEPPLGDIEDHIALINGIKSGVIDAIAIDHQAYTYEEKTVAFALSPPGVIGLKLALPLLWQELVETGKLSALELWQALSSNPLRCLQQKPQTIAPRQNLDLTLFATQEIWVVNRNTLKSPAANTPFFNQEITGKVVKTWIN